ncbi:MAG: stage III sporulation protein SpoIIIAB [Bacillota bacterium]
MIGALIVVFAGTVTGMQLGGFYARRPRELKSLTAALLLLKTEISYAATPLPEALTEVARRADPAVSPFFNAAAFHLKNFQGTTAARAWSEALAETGHTLALREEDAEVLRALGTALGNSCREEQAQHISLAIERIKAAATSAEADAVRYERLYKFLGFGTGAALAILLY